MKLALDLFQTAAGVIFGMSSVRLCNDENLLIRFGLANFFVILLLGGAYFAYQNFSGNAKGKKKL